jgi:hypothetical protein
VSLLFGTPVQFTVLFELAARERYATGLSLANFASPVWIFADANVINTMSKMTTFLDILKILIGGWSTNQDKKKLERSTTSEVGETDDGIEFRIDIFTTSDWEIEKI